MKSILIKLILALVLLILGACNGKTKPEPGSYVVLSPEVAEIIAALGAADEISGLTRECTYPPQLQEKVIVGDFGAINKETVLRLSPQIVFTSALEQEAITLDLQKLGIRVHKSYPKTMADMLDEIITIGELIGRSAEARALRDSLEREIAAISQEAAGKTRPKVYLEIYRDPLMSVADNSFVGELIELAGGDNVFDRLERDYARVKAEQVVEANPDIMICYSQDTLQNVISRKGWGRIPAISQRRIYFEDAIDPDLIQRAGPRSISGMRLLANIFEQWRRETE
jgi:iron complex transport system substrate-binding protein